MLFEPKERPAELFVVMEGFRSNRGRIMVAMYGSEKTWMTEKAIANTFRSVTSSTMTVAFRGDFARGTYAISAFHDENGNMKLDTHKESGIPLEGFGFSNDAKIMGGPAKWESASFRIDSEKKVIKFKIHYP